MKNSKNTVLLIFLGTALVTSGIFVLTRSTPTEVTQPFEGMHPLYGSNPLTTNPVSNRSAIGVLGDFSRTEVVFQLVMMDDGNVHYGPMVLLGPTRHDLPPLLSVKWKGTIGISDEILPSGAVRSSLTSWLDARYSVGVESKCLQHRLSKVKGVVLSGPIGPTWSVVYIESNGVASYRRPVPLDSFLEAQSGSYLLIAARTSPTS